MIRKYAADGTPMWTVAYENDTFYGPNLALLGFDASVDIDVLGYVYVTAIVYDDLGTDWWARKLHP
jgi:hypothetical protein